MTIVPGARPQATRAEIFALAAAHGLDPVAAQLCLIGVRGYYSDTMGAPGVNDRRLYDDAIFVFTPNSFAAFNANVDPSGYRKGSGGGAAKGMASLKPGLYHAHRLGLHKGKYLALVQTAGAVTVMRDGSPPYADSGYFGINIHRGGVNSTSSLGCQTVPPAQYPEFIGLVSGAAKALDGAAWRSRVIPYLLLEGPVR